MLNRVAHRDPVCRNTLLGGTLKLYGFKPQETEKLMAVAAARTEAMYPSEESTVTVGPVQFLDTEALLGPFPHKSD